MKDELDGCLTDDSKENQKAKDTKKCVIKWKNFEDYTNCLEATQL